MVVGLDFLCRQIGPPHRGVPVGKGKRGFRQPWPLRFFLQSFSSPENKRLTQRGLTRRTSWIPVWGSIRLGSNEQSLGIRKNAQEFGKFFGETKNYSHLEDGGRAIRLMKDASGEKLTLDRVYLPQHDDVAPLRTAFLCCSPLFLSCFAGKKEGGGVEPVVMLFNLSKVSRGLSRKEPRRVSS